MTLILKFERMWPLIIAFLGLLVSACQDVSKETSSRPSQTAIAEQTVDGASLFHQRCAACHSPTDTGGNSRISQVRKTPEGWFMTVVRMEREGRVVVNRDERRAVVKYLSDSQGLAPVETADFRYILEKRPNIIESPADPELAVMCGRCHSNARYSLQRRDADEWRKLVSFHVVQFPTLEYQTMSAERRWFEEATTEFASRLGENFPLQSTAWDNWRANGMDANPSGQWRVVGYEPGKGRYEGIATISALGGDNYQAVFALSYTDGDAWKGRSEALLYSGYEWRGRNERNGAVLREVYALSEDGSRLSGRWLDIDRDERGGDWTAVRMDAGDSLLAVDPPYLRIGKTREIRLLGVALEGIVDFGPGVKHEIVSRSATEIVVNATSVAGSSQGLRQVSVGSTEFQGSFSLYDRVDTIKVIPENAVARVGGAGGKLLPVPAQFEAVGYNRGADGKPNTEDDIRIGVFPATWSHSDFDELATELEDARFAGQIDNNGRFQPAVAGINPDRYISTNNVGVLAITGTVIDDDRELSGTARLVVTVQRFINPPIN
ncbi:MAG: quinohemoprotein amine dehydrogenase subunit alpha [Gammaproteobacteria bacterium]|nr:MAG: quinohemoprotein amine dehydrogenase subunit alpha [Gammaproteobacteria bacterium]